MNPSAEFDVIVYGATGFTGRLVAEYLAQQYGIGGDVKWAMAGRSEDKLKSVRDEMGISSGIPLVTADSSDKASLASMAKSAKAIITTVGPYQLYGTDLLAACAEHGTDYVDLSGEPAWMHDTVEQFDAAAKKSGARIVHSCGFDSVPFDLGVYFTQQAAIEKFGAPCNRIKGRVRKISDHVVIQAQHLARIGAKGRTIIGKSKLTTRSADQLGLQQIL